MALGDHEKALEWLEKAYKAGHFYIKGLGIYPGRYAKRTDPRFQDMMRRIGLLDKFEQ